MPRQNWRVTPTVTRTNLPSSCTPYSLPSGLSIPLDDGATFTVLTAPIVVTPSCYTDQESSESAQDESLMTFQIGELRDPFYTSSIPMAYSIAATTTLAYVLLLLLFLPNPPRRRPWLQKIATLTVCICLTIAFVETTAVLKREYVLAGSSVYTQTNEARLVRAQVISGYPIKVGRVVSDLFLWLAQVQTLIRLFPRQREKMVIKWAGLCLIILDTLFSVLESFVSPLASVDSFLDAIPALSYLFQISLSLLYACCVIYYSFAKRRFAYFYPHRLFSPTPGSKKYGGQSIFLVAILSIASILTPIVFFILDIAQKDIAGWGDYVRWVGAAATSVVVWEWVDRIEGLEREERKGGVLGREVYEEDEDHRFDERDVGRDSRGGGGGAGGGGDESWGRGGGIGRWAARAATATASDSTRYEVRQEEAPTPLSGSEKPPTVTGTATTGTTTTNGTTISFSPGSHLSSLQPSPPPPPPPALAPDDGLSKRWPWLRLPRSITTRTSGSVADTPLPLPVTIIPPPQRRRRAIPPGEEDLEMARVDRAAREEMARDRAVSSSPPLRLQAPQRRASSWTVASSRLSPPERSESDSPRATVVDEVALAQLPPPPPPHPPLSPTPVATTITSPLAPQELRGLQWTSNVVVVPAPQRRRTTQND